MVIERDRVIRVHLHPFNIISFINLEGICTNDKEQIKLFSNSHVHVAV